MDPEALLYPLLLRQDGVVTTKQALDAGVTRGQLAGLTGRGWSRPARSVYVQPEPRDPFRASVRAALLICPQAATYGKTAARLHELWGLPLWTPAELPELIVPVGTVRRQRSGMRVKFGLEPADRLVRKGFPATNLARTVSDLAVSLPLDDLICLLDRALAKGWRPDDRHLTRRQEAQLGRALRLADARSESPLETVLRLLFVRAGLAPETLQLQLFTRDGVCYARLDFAWPSCRLAVEADGRDPHDKPQALYQDRVRQNNLVLDGWTVLRFTWDDVHRRPHWVVAQVGAALQKLRLAHA